MGRVPLKSTRARGFCTLSVAVILMLTVGGCATGSPPSLRSDDFPLSLALAFLGFDVSEMDSGSKQSVDRSATVVVDHPNGSTFNRWSGARPCSVGPPGACTQ